MSEHTPEESSWAAARRVIEIQDAEIASLRAVNAELLAGLEEIAAQAQSMTSSANLGVEYPTAVIAARITTANVLLRKIEAVIARAKELANG